MVKPLGLIIDQLRVAHCCLNGAVNTLGSTPKSPPPFARQALGQWQASSVG